MTVPLVTSMVLGELFVKARITVLFIFHVITFPLTVSIWLISTSVQVGVGLTTVLAGSPPAAVPESKGGRLKICVVVEARRGRELVGPTTLTVLGPVRPPHAAKS